MFLYLFCYNGIHSSKNFRRITLTNEVHGSTQQAFLAQHQLFSPNTSEYIFDE